MKKEDRDKALVTIGENLRNNRELAGYTAEEMARLLGIAVRTLRAYEYGEHQMSLKTAVRISEICGTTVTRLIGISGSDSADKFSDPKLLMYKRIRKMLGMNQTEFANEIGASRSSISDYESGYSSMPIKVFIRFCNVCGLSERDINSLARNMTKNAL